MGHTPPPPPSGQPPLVAHPLQPVYEVHPPRRTRSPLPFSLDTGEVKIGIKGLLTLILSIAFAVAGGAYTWATMATKADVTSAVATNPATAAMRVAVDANTTQIKGLTVQVGQLAGKEQVSTLQGRIDFLIERELMEAERSSSTRRVVRQAAARVRKRAGAVRGDHNDPLAGLDGL